MAQAVSGKHFGLLGEKLSHSFSPQIHAMLGDYEYLLYEKAPDDVAGFLQSGNFDGLNVTIPYKKTVLPFCDALSDAARTLGSVNTIVRRSDGSLYGDNTDFDGFSYLLNTLGTDISGRKTLVLGSGGASVTVRAVLESRSADPIVTISRSGPDNYENLSRHADAQIIVNTTPVGMYPNVGVSPIDLSVFSDCQAVIDIVYNPAKTSLLLDAADHGIASVNGLGMLVAQAKRAAELFTNATISDDVIAGITAVIERDTKNIVLIGMPGSGKSTTGAALALQLGRPFFDTDTLIVEKAGKSIPQILADDGEPAFRRLETQALADVAKKSGCVIATGGGIVTQPENRRLIRQNSTCVYLERDTAALPTSGRPLSQKSGVAALAAARLPLYNSWSDVTVRVCGVDETVALIQKELKL